jgi:hypothetical protein
MKVVTKDCLSIKCKFIEFLETEIIITLWDDSKEVQPTSNIDYISLS